MQNVRRRDTPCEVAVRRALHARGLRYRLDSRPLADVRRKADIVFRGAKVAVFVDGCFWHGCPEHATWPRANAEWWRQKIQTNKERDADTDARLTGAGWTSVRVWEHEDPNTAARRIAKIVRRGHVRESRLGTRPRTS